MQLRAPARSTNGKVSIHGTVDRHNAEYTVDEVADAVVDGEAEHTLSGGCAGGATTSSSWRTATARAPRSSRRCGRGSPFILANWRSASSR